MRDRSGVGDLARRSARGGGQVLGAVGWVGGAGVSQVGGGVGEQVSAVVQQR